MGLISRVSSRTYRKLAMAETFKKNVIIDAQDHLAGRLCATVAKELLRGNNVIIVRCEGIFITGNYYRNKLIMLENKTGRGTRAHNRLTCYDGCPPPFDVQKKFK